MEPSPNPLQQSASSYYNKYRKRSFFLSRLTVLTSMVILIITLGINISLLTSHEKSTATTHADTPQNPAQILPTLPAGCVYQQTQKGLAVVCPTPTSAVTVPINIALPQMPPQCLITTSSTGSEVHCTTTAVIPTVPVSLPTTCDVASSSAKDTVTCNKNNQPVTVPLPSLPGGCSYTLLANKYYVTCKAL